VKYAEPLQYVCCWCLPRDGAAESGTYQAWPPKTGSDVMKPLAAKACTLSNCRMLLFPQWQRACTGHFADSVHSIPIYFIKPWFRKVEKQAVLILVDPSLCSDNVIENAQQSHGWAATGWKRLPSWTFLKIFVPYIYPCKMPLVLHGSYSAGNFLGLPLQLRRCSRPHLSS